MKNTMKKIIHGLFSLLLMAGLMAFLACQKESIFPKGNTIVPIAKGAIGVGDISETNGFEVYPAPQPFNFEIETSKCKTTQPKINLEVVIVDNTAADKFKLPSKFKYKWEVNGKVVGTDPMLPCFCADAVTVTVTRVADNKKVKKSMRLWVCNTVDANATDYESY